jgi:hypothetical protein
MARKGPGAQDDDEKLLLDESPELTKDKPGRDTPIVRKDKPGSDKADSYYLGVLNRHWYRRCLDGLEKALREAGNYPSVEELKKLCDQVISTFLSAVMSQAPDSERLQFPADRAMFIPLERDNAGEFNFVKAFFQFTQASYKAQSEIPSNPLPKEYNRDKFDNSIWSFFPWCEKSDSVFINQEQSVNDRQETISFEDLISVRELFRQPSAAQDKDKMSGAVKGLRLKKGLLARGSDHLKPTYLNSVLTDLNAEKRPAKPEQGEPYQIEFAETIRTALVAVFEIYRLTPGNAAVEFLLQNHLHVIHWLHQRSIGAESASQQKETYAKLFRVFLEAFFLRANAYPSAKKTDDSLSPSELADWLQVECEEEVNSMPFSREQVAHALNNQGIDTPFHKWLDDMKGQAAKEQNAVENEGIVKDELAYFEKNLKPHLRNFRHEFLNPAREQQLESDLAATLQNELTRAGETKQSFVWVCPDFESVQESVHKKWKLRGARVPVQERSAALNAAYKEFFRRLDVNLLGDKKRKVNLEEYWKTVGLVARPERVFASFSCPGAGIGRDDQLPFAPSPPFDETDEQLSGAVPSNKPRSRATEERGTEKNGWSPDADPRPQNIFLRVRICDPLNEPVINGLFIFTTDHDEVRFKGKDPKLRQEDVQDLLSFAKVYFFTVRDYFRGLDQARDARDIGRLNQFLYDECLSNLDSILRDRKEGYRDRGITQDDCWDRFAYEILNIYAGSLVKKPPEVRIETFPYDRLLLLPLAAHGAGTRFDLPFFLFQAVFVEWVQGKIDKNHYSLLKPYQSPVDAIDAKGGQERFSRSFQQVTEVQGQTVARDRYLEKLYVSATVPSSTAGSATDENVPSYVPKVPGSFDFGRRWCENALDRFWSTSEKEPERYLLTLWGDFLRQLTEDCKRLEKPDADTTSDSAHVHWFWLRFGLLRVLLNHLPSSTDEKHPFKLFFEEVEQSYLKELRLRFNDDPKLNVLTRAKEETPPVLFKKLTNSLAPSQPAQVRAGTDHAIRIVTDQVGFDNDETKDVVGVNFVPFQLGNQDPFVMRFLQILTYQVANKDTSKPEAEQTPSTWYQPLLTRPLDHATLDHDDSTLHLKAGKTLGERLPQYDRIVQQEDSFSAFLAIVNIRVGGSNERDARRLSYLIAIIRDYDDAKTNITQSKDEIQDQVETDRRDLTLFTGTYFQDVKKFVVDAIQAHQVHVLSNDISQIARNWYSGGTDAILAALEQKLRSLIRLPGNPDLGRLRPEIVDCFFDELLQVLLRQETRRHEQGLIGLESFPFDRLLHIPLSAKPALSARLCYARTMVDVPKWKVTGDEVYKQIRKFGRIWDSKDGKKKKYGTAYHIGAVIEPGAERDLVGILFGTASNQTRLASGLKQLMDGQGVLDELLRGLYEVNVLQALAQGGLICHLLRLLEDAKKQAEKEGKKFGLLVPDGITEKLERIWNVLDSRLRSLERLDGQNANDGRLVVTHPYVDMDGAGLAFAAQKGKLPRVSAEMPLFREFFEAVAAGGEFEYGLGKDSSTTSVRSKVFFIYYSLKAPDEFTEELHRDGRYRGVFCLITDDQTTDPKKGAALVTDREDIRTFIHNSIGGLRLILEQQALYNKIIQPGVEDFIIATLHRLKNDLNIPYVTLRQAKEFLELATGKSGSVSLRQEEVKDLRSSIDVAQATISGTEELFNSLHNLGSLQRGIVPLRTLSNVWLGWLFVSKLCDAARKGIDYLKNEAEHAKDNAEDAKRERGRTLQEAQQEVLGIGKTAKHRLKEVAKSPYQEEVGEKLLHLQTHLTKVVKAARPGLSAVKLFFTYRVFDMALIKFRGSIHLDEAINILIENAFQAMWGHLLASRATSADGRLEMVCRRDSAVEEQVLIEIWNSSAPLKPSLLKELNAETARPLTKQQPAASSGKKSSSGFGHYHARQIVAHFCGGRQERRKLGILVEEIKPELVRLRVNLLEAVEKQPKVHKSSDLSSWTARIFDQAIVQDEHDWRNQLAGKIFFFPGSLGLEDLIQTIKELLASDRQRIEGELLSLLNNNLCGKLVFVTQCLVMDLQKAIVLSSNDEQYVNLKPTLENLNVELTNRVRASSCFDVISWIQKQTDVERDVLQRVANAQAFWKVKGASNSSQLLIGLLAKSRLHPRDFLPNDQVREQAHAFQKFRALLQEPDFDKSLAAFFEHVDQNENGKPIFPAKHVADACKKSTWVYGGKVVDGKLLLDFYLCDGAHPAEQTGGQSLDEGKLLERFGNEPLAQMFVEYREYLRQEAEPGKGPMGDISFVCPVGDAVGSHSYRRIQLELTLASDREPARKVTEPSTQSVRAVP